MTKQEEQTKLRENGYGYVVERWEANLRNPSVHDRRINADLNHAFYWSSSPEKHGFWGNIFRFLHYDSDLDIPKQSLRWR